VTLNIAKENRLRGAQGAGRGALWTGRDWCRSVATARQSRPEHRLRRRSDSQSGRVLTRSLAPPILGDRKIRSELVQTTWPSCRMHHVSMAWSICPAIGFVSAHDRSPKGGRAGLVGTTGIRIGKAREAALDYIVLNGGPSQTQCLLASGLGRPLLTCRW